jgi:two-component system, cell cycle sensor histidine kinase and response regulator CckA
MAQKPTYVELENRIDSLEEKIRVLKEAEEERKRCRQIFDSEERYRALIHEMGNGFALHEIILDKNGTPCDYRFLEVNTAFEKMTGLKTDDIIGKTVLEILPKTESYWIEAYGKVALTGDSLTYENYAQEFDGYFEVLAYSPRKGKFVTIFTDTTERKKSEKALGFTQFAIDRSSDAAFWMGKNAQFIYVNDMACRSLGYSKEKLLGMTVFDISPDFPPETWQAHWAELQRRGSFIFETTHRRKDGNIFPVEIAVNYVRFGEEEYNCAFARDITDRKQEEETREKLKAQLQQAQKMEAIATLGGGIAHQFNNALSPILTGLNLIEMHLPEGYDISRYADPMRESAHRMSSLTNQLLAYARGGRYQKTTLSLDSFLKNTLPIIEHTLKPSVLVETDIPHDILGVEVDMTQIQMVLSAILSNASEAIEEQGRIRIACRNEMIADESVENLAGLAPGSYVYLKIEDDGKGMDSETASQVFDPFFTTKFQGRGLGMAAAYGIIRNHNGAISVESELGKGTTVHIYLPAAYIGTIERTATNPPFESCFDNVTVLVIEDEEIVMEMTTALLEKIGCRVLQAKTGADALDMAKKQVGGINLALLDIKLPDIDGDRLYPLLIKERPDLKVIVCSGYSIDGPAQEILDAGAEGFMQKPFGLKELQAKIGKILDDG